MNDARALLDRFLGQAQGGGSSPAGPGGGDGAGGQGALGAVQQAAGNFNLQGMLQGKGGILAGAAAGGLAGLLLGGKKPRKLAGTALKVGGVALVGGLAYKAWRDWQANKAPAPTPAVPSVPSAPVALPSPEGTVFLPDNRAEQDDLSLTLIRAMIAAAKADGHIDEAERTRIAGQLDAVELGAEERAFIEQELAKPLDVSAVAAGATCPERAAEIYAASLLAIDPNGAAEKGYLAMLAARMNLDPDLVAHLHANAAQVTDQV